MTRRRREGIFPFAPFFCTLHFAPVIASNSWKLLRTLCTWILDCFASSQWRERYCPRTSGYDELYEYEI